MANVTSVPTAAEETFFQFGTPENPNPRLAAPAPANATVYTLTAPPLDHLGNVISVDFLMGVRDAVSGYVTNVHVPASGISVDGLTLTGCTSGVALEGLDWTTGDPLLAPAINQDSPVFCVVSGVERAMTQAGLTAAIGANIKFNGRNDFMEDGVLNFRPFVDATARDAAITSPIGGDTAFLTGLQVGQIYRSGGWADLSVGTVYSAGNGLSLTGSVFSVNTADTTTFVKTSSGAADNNKVPVLDAGGQLASGFIKQDYILKSVLTAKGDIVTATAANTPSVVSVGTNGQMVLADSAQTSGWNWFDRFKTGVNTHASNVTDVQTIAHGLGRLPGLLTVTAGTGMAGPISNTSIGYYDGLSTNTYITFSSTPANNGGSATDTTNIVVMVYGCNTLATATFDATNIYLSWTAGGGALTINFSWKVE